MYYRKRGNTWFFGCTCQNMEGKTIKVERAGGLTKPEARKSALQFLQGLDHHGRFFHPEDVLLVEFLDTWEKNYVELKLSDNTIMQYHRNLENHIKPAFTGVRLGDLTKMGVQKFVNDLKASRLYAASTLSQILATLKRALAYAVSFDLIEKNPASGVIIPESKKDAVDEPEKPTEAHVFSPIQLQKIFEHFGPGHLFYLPIQISYHTGMRLGECLGLRWAAVDLDSKMIKVVANLVDKDGWARLRKPKSKASIREIPIDDDLCNILREAHRRQAVWRLKFGEDYDDHDLVCARENGKFVTSSDMRYFGKFCKENFKAGSFHSLRHTHATFLLENGWSLEDVSKRLGHASIAITSKIYSHITAERREQQRQRLNEAFCSYSPTPPHSGNEMAKMAVSPYGA